MSIDITKIVILIPKVCIIFLCLEKLEYKMFQYAALHAIQKNIFMLAKNIPVAKD